jgi:hypothetical protein
MEMESPKNDGIDAKFIKYLSKLVENAKRENQLAIRRFAEEKAKCDQVIIDLEEVTNCSSTTSSESGSSESGSISSEKPSIVESSEDVEANSSKTFESAEGNVSEDDSDSDWETNESGPDFEDENILNDSELESDFGISWELLMTKMSKLKLSCIELKRKFQLDGSEYYTKNNSKKFVKKVHNWNI